MDSEQGSSPLARGTLVLIMLLLMVFGLIPARAGNTPRLRCVIRFSRAHPRSRGEHWFTVSSLTCYLGSSPLARGTLSRHRAQLLKLGLIPARAGNTRHRDHSTPCPRAHPRSRGEHPSNPPQHFQIPGSSPLARGTLCGLPVVTLCPGLIPARAGNTGHLLPLVLRRRAHPRSRGEHLKPGYGEICAWGSSPLARGTHVRFIVVRLLAGLIPARAGNTRTLFASSPAS